MAFYSDIYSTGYITLPLKVIIIPFIVFYFKCNQIKSTEVYLCVTALAGAYFFVEGNPIAPVQALNKNEFGHYLLCFFCLLSFSFLNTNKNINWKKTGISFMIIIVIVGVTLFSRQFLVSVILGLIFVYIRFNLFSLAKVALILFASYFSVQFIAENVLNGYNQRRLKFFTSSSDMTRADLHRYENIIWGVEEFLKAPWIGYGLGSFRANSPTGLVAHNTYLSAIYELGLLGLGAILLIILGNFIALSRLKMARKNFASSCVTLFLFSLLVQAIFMDVLAKFSLLILLTGPLLLRQHLRNRKRQESAAFSL